MFKLPDLPYPYDALEPAIDKMTMEIHHQKHHGGYVEKLNKAIEGHKDLEALEISELLQKIDILPEEIRQAVRNNGGGHANHSLFWEIMSPGAKVLSEGELFVAIEKYFGGFDKFVNEFSEVAATHFGSGWAFLVMNQGMLEIITLPNQDSPLMENKIPILGLDVWEHAYYLKYQNRRTEYINSWWSVVNWPKVEERFRNLR